MFRHERKDKAVHLALSFCLRDLYESADKIRRTGIPEIYRKRISKQRENRG